MNKSENDVGHSARGSSKRKNMESMTPSRDMNFSSTSSFMSSGITTMCLGRDEANYSKDGTLDEEIATRSIKKGEQRSVRQKLDDGVGSNTTKRSDTQNCTAQSDGEQCIVATENALCDNELVQVDDNEIQSPLGNHSRSCPGSVEGAQTETGSMVEAQIHGTELDTGSSSNPQDSPCQERTSTSPPADVSKASIEGVSSSTKTPKPSYFQWPMWPVSYLLESSTMETVISYYRRLNLANEQNDKNLRLFLEEQHHKEAIGLSEDLITRRLWTFIYPETATSDKNLDLCSICMVEFKPSDRIASLYYCPHQYHADCIKGWLLKSNICPLCRALALIPEEYPDWNGDIRLHRAFFMRKRF